MPWLSTQALIGAGANLGDRAATLEAAVDCLRTHPQVSHLVTSPLYETVPVGLTDQPAFFNQVIGIETSLSPEALLALLLEIEQQFGRMRTVRWGPRTLDLDLLAYECETRTSAELQLPHPRMWERAFVRVPLRHVLALPRFQRSAWDAFRAKLRDQPSEAEGVDFAGDYRRAQNYWLGVKKRGVRPGLERMQRLAAALGHPQHRVPCIHIAGTNGKGSVAAMLEGILRAAGWRVGLYTSPHLVRLGERIQVNRQPLTNASLARATEELRFVVERIAETDGQEATPSYFEFITAMAFTHFAREHCDVAVIETGMGGRLDATNVVTPVLSVITSIGLDHCEFLGQTLAQIATEKAGIIKSNRPVVLGPLVSEAEAQIRAIAAQRSSPVHSVAERWPESTRYPRSNLPGRHQRANAAVATLAARALPEKWRITEETITRALENVDWPGRWQRLPIGNRELILDGAHNVEGAQTLEEALTDLVQHTGRLPIVVVGVLGAVRAKALLTVIARHAREIHLVAPQQSRACSTDELGALLPTEYRGAVHRTNIDAIFPTAATCALGASGDTVVVTGSLYLIGEVLARLDPARGPLEGHLQDF